MATDLRRFVAVSAASVLGLLLILEGGARLIARGRSADNVRGDEWLEYASDVGWRRKPGFTGEVYGSYRRFDDRGWLSVDTPQLEHREHDLVLVLGDSRSFGNAVPVEAIFSEALDRQVPDLDVVNWGVPGYSSFQGLQEMRRLVPLYRPKYVIFAFGFNDRRYVPSSRNADSLETFERQWRWRKVNGWLRSSRLLDLLARALEGAPVRKRGIDLGSTVARVDLPSYRQNLAAAAGVCRTYGCRLIFLVLADNPVSSAELSRGLALVAQGRLQEAKAALGRAIDSDNAFSDAARKALAATLRQEGAERLARQAERTPEALLYSSGGKPLYDDTGVRQAAFDMAPVPGTSVVDASPWQRAHPASYFDFCHFNARAHEAIARLLSEEIASLRKAALAAPSNE